MENSWAMILYHPISVLRSIRILNLSIQEHKLHEETELPIRDKRFNLKTKKQPAQLEIVLVGTNERNPHPEKIILTINKSESQKLKQILNEARF